jgi:hypothetical protein
MKKTALEIWLHLYQNVNLDKITVCNKYTSIWGEKVWQHLSTKETISTTKKKIPNFTFSSTGTISMAEITKLIAKHCFA